MQPYWSNGLWRQLCNSNGLDVYDLTSSLTGDLFQNHALSCRHSGAPLSPSPQTAENKSKERRTNLAELERHYARTHHRNPSHSPVLPMRAPQPSHLPCFFICSPAPAGQPHSDSARPAQELTNRVTSFCLSCHTREASSKSRSKPTPTVLEVLGTPSP